MEDGNLVDEEVVDAHGFVDGKVGDNGNASRSGAIVSQSDVLNAYALDDSMVARNVQYILGSEVPCKALFLGKSARWGS